MQKHSKPEAGLRIARNLITRHGMRAAAVAAEHATQHAAQGNHEAATDWHGIARAITELRAASRPPNR
jgi:hypothetical protein